MFLKSFVITSVVILLISSKSNGESYNLFGIPGQGYLIEVKIGHPHQKLNVLLDTGSSTLAVATVPGPQVSTYFHSDNSTSIYKSKNEVKAEYSQGGWFGTIASDYVQFPSLGSSVVVRSDMVLITKDYDFFMNGSGWQGILGLAYQAIAVGNSDTAACPWLDSVDLTYGITKSFEMSLCGVRSRTNATHYGSFALLDDKTIKPEDNTTIYSTPILRERWYEIGVLGVRLINNTKGNSTLFYNSVQLNLNSTKNKEEIYQPMKEMCRSLNAKKSIVDSGTTNIRLPTSIFRQVVDDLHRAAVAANLLILDEFWYHGEADCFPEPQQWQLPWLAVHLLDSEDDQQYFTLEIPPQNYIRLVSAHNSSNTVAEFCYKFGLEAHPTDTVLGVAAMEGFQITFNRSANIISWKEAECGPNVHISGPHKLNTSILNLCKLEKYSSLSTVGSIKTAQWAVGIFLSVAMALLLYLLAPCLRNRLLRKLNRSSSQISLSRAVLVEQEET